MFKFSRLTKPFSKRRRTLFRAGFAMVAGLLAHSASVAGPSVVEVPALNATVDELLFYESARGIPAQADRKYNTEFSASQARFINWELRLQHPAPGRKSDFRIDATYLDPKGQVMFENYVDTYFTADWTSSNHSWGYGNDTPGAAWSPGIHRLDIYIAGAKIASGTFTIVSGAGGVAAPDNRPAEKLEIPEDLGEL